MRYVIREPNNRELLWFDLKAVILCKLLLGLLHFGEYLIFILSKSQHYCFFPLSAVISFLVTKVFIGCINTFQVFEILDAGSFEIFTTFGVSCRHLFYFFQFSIYQAVHFLPCSRYAVVLGNISKLCYISFGSFNIWEKAAFQFCNLFTVIISCVIIAGRKDQCNNGYERDFVNHKQFFRNLRYARLSYLIEEDFIYLQF